MRRRGPAAPLGTLASELIGEPGVGRLDINEAFNAWQLLLQHALESLRAAGYLRTDADPERLAIATLASLQGGLLMSKALQDEAPLAVALDAAIDHLRSFAHA